MARPTLEILSDLDDVALEERLRVGAAPGEREILRKVAAAVTSYRICEEYLRRKLIG